MTIAETCSNDSSEDILMHDGKDIAKDQSPLQSTILYEKDSSATPSDEQSSAIYQKDKLESIFYNSQNGVLEISPANMFQSEKQKTLSLNADHVESEVYEQDKLEDVFKQGRTDGNNSGEFAFGFLSKPEMTAAESCGNMAPFSFGLVPNTDTSGLQSRQKSIEESSNNRQLDSDANKNVQSDQELMYLSKKRQVKRKKFTEHELDKYEDLFFSLNEGPQILNDLDGMKQEATNQELWQKERQILTSDWKRKQKAALSRKGKKGS